MASLLSRESRTINQAFLVASASRLDVSCLLSEGSKAFEYHIDCLPADTQEAVRQRHFKSVLEQSDCKSDGLQIKRNSLVKPREELEIMRQCPALVEREVATLTDDQKKVADARALLAQEVEKLRAAGMSRIAAVTFIADGSRKGTLPARVMVAAGLANARKGSSRIGVSKSCLQSWLTLYLTTKPGLERLALLAPGQPKRKRPEDVVWFFGTLQQPERPQRQRGIPLVQARLVRDV
ncbi:hypothetical protein [Serratia symbiotica]|uniref:hypothetical protein n=2 Tax=Serratia symbiotica TaxID=138074 RepID=UPI0011F0D9F8|nr:hypothetical protein [Serratia symbiotica]